MGHSSYSHYSLRFGGCYFKYSLKGNGIYFSALLGKSYSLKKGYYLLANVHDLHFKTFIHSCWRKLLSSIFIRNTPINMKFILILQHFIEDEINICMNNDTNYYNNWYLTNTYRLKIWLVFCFIILSITQANDTI